MHRLSTRLSRFKLSPLKVFVLTLLTPVTPAFADLWAVSTDVSFSRVIRFDNHGNELPGGIPTGSAGLSAPGGITVGPDGTIYVSSRGTAQILAYTCGAASCAPKNFVGGTPGLFAQFAPADQAAPAQLKFGPDGKLYVSELFGQHVRVYDPATRNRLPDAASQLPGAGGLAFEADGSLLVGTVAVPADQNPLGMFPIPSTISHFSNGQQLAPYYVDTDGSMQFPSSLTFKPNGDLIAVDLFGDTLWQFLGNGEFKFGFGELPIISEGKPRFPSDVVYDPDGNLIVALLGPNNPGDPGGNLGELVRFSVDGHYLETIADHLEQVGALAWTASPQTLAGDYDNNGVVNAADYTKWKGDFGKFVATANGADGNGNGIVDAGDYTIWRNHVSGAGAGSLSAEAVPESSTCLLLALGAIASLGARFRSYLWN